MSPELTKQPVRLGLATGTRHHELTDVQLGFHPGDLGQHTICLPGQHTITVTHRQRPIL